MIAFLLNKKTMADTTAFPIDRNPYRWIVFSVAFAVISRFLPEAITGWASGGAAERLPYMVLSNSLLTASPSFSIT